MTARRARMLDRSVRHWVREAQASRGYARRRAWGNALATAELIPDRWIVWHSPPGQARKAALFEVVSVGPRGGIKARKHYLTRSPGRVH